MTIPKSHKPLWSEESVHDNHHRKDSQGSDDLIKDQAHDHVKPLITAGEFPQHPVYPKS
ncbi:MAG: hypothetical protein O2856_17335 [Planctomycetota bacterium]|nr:hypothetical protein [Planctomycetota bacterium]